MYGIMRFKKLKTKGELAGSGAHVARSRTTDNADPARSRHNKLLAGSEDVIQAVEARYKAAKATKRKNGVLVYEFVITASPEFFREKNEYGHHEVELTEALGKRAVSWLKKEFGEENVISATMHLDEATPHIHAYATPLRANKKGKWAQAAKQWTGSRKLCSELQDRFAKAVSDLGLKRGIRGSRAKHSEVKQYYEALSATDVEEIPSLDVLPPSSGWSVRTKELRVQYAEEETQRLRSQVRPVVEKYQVQARAAAMSKRKELEYKKTAEKYQAEASLLEDIPMSEILFDLGYQENVLNKETGKEVGMLGNLFFDDQNESRGHGSIELAMYLLDCGPQEAISYLGRTFGQDKAKGAIICRARHHAPEEVRQAMNKYPLPRERQSLEQGPDLRPETVPEVEEDLDQDHVPGLR
jgi:hypothetical protein